MIENEGEGNYLRRAIAAGCLGLIAVVSLALILTPEPEAKYVPQGDALGPETGETFEEYRQRVSLVSFEGQRFALITFSRALSPEEASTLLEPIGRVSAFQEGITPATAIPEPVTGTTRAEVFRGAGAGSLLAVVVYADYTQLSAIANNPQVAVVEALGEGAVWGTFAIRPPAVVDV